MAANTIATIQTPIDIVLFHSSPFYLRLRAFACGVPLAA